jgi:Peptidase family M50
MYIRQEVVVRPSTHSAHREVSRTVMPKLKRFLSGCFGFFSISFLLAAITTVPLASRITTVPVPLRPHAVSPADQWAILSLSKFLFVLPLFLGYLFAMAWWTTRKGKASARAWALGASVLIVLQGVPLLVFALYTARAFPLERLPESMVILNVLMTALGILGIVVYLRRDSTAVPAVPVKPPRIAGDGTSAVMDLLAWILAIAGYFLLEGLWMRWWKGRDLPVVHGATFWILFLLAFVVNTVTHELGHAGVGIALGMKLRAFIVGPFQLRVLDGRWKLQFFPSKLFSAGGAAALVPSNPGEPKWRQISMIAAGPVASLLTGLIAAALALLANGTPYERYWQFFSLLSIFGLVSFVVNLLPVRPDALYSDGARIYQLVRGGPWADLWRAFSIAGAATVTPLRPRDYDIEAIRRASPVFRQGQHAMVLRLFATSYYLDRGDLDQARAWLAEAESMYPEVAAQVSADLLTSFVFDSAFLCRDAVSARQWWGRMEAKKPTHLGFDYWLAQSALFWVENRSDEAREAWTKADKLAQNLPSAGMCQFDRYRCSEMKRLLEGSAATRSEAENRFIQRAIVERSGRGSADSAAAPVVDC